MDTDSAYMALSGELEDLVPDRLREDFYLNYEYWFPAQFCPRHQWDFVQTREARKEWRMKPCCEEEFRYHRRTPGLFKEEFSGDGIVALNSKTYFCWSEKETKYSSKGLNKRSNRLKKESFLNVLETQKSLIGTNRGFVKKKQHLYTYNQKKRGITYFYAKRKVWEDGVSTEPIDA